MRLWSLHPRFLDVKGLLAAWREGLLAQAVLRGETRGYRAHPQLQRFQAQARPTAAVAAYLRGVWEEAARRGYAFDRAKIRGRAGADKIPVTRGQAAFELAHLRAKLRRRDPARLQHLPPGAPRAGDLHPLFALRAGPVADWEKR